MFRPPSPCLIALSLAIGASVNASTISFEKDPFAGTTVLSTPGRQVVGGELFVAFDTASDVFGFSSSAFGVAGPVDFVNALSPALPTSGVNVVVLEDFDNDNNPLTPFGAGNAADLIALHVTEHGAGFFVYFNQSLDIPRLVYSTDLASNTADLRILARMLNLNGSIGRNRMAEFSAANFDITTDAAAVPEPPSLALALTGLGLCLVAPLRRRLRSRNHAWFRQLPWPCGGRPGAAGAVESRARTQLAAEGVVRQRGSCAGIQVGYASAAATVKGALPFAAG